MARIVVCDTVPLDRVRNASRRRRRLSGEAAADLDPTGLDPLALIEAEHYDRVRPVGAPRRAIIGGLTDDPTDAPAPSTTTPDDPTDEEE